MNKDNNLIKKFKEKVEELKNHNIFSMYGLQLFKYTLGKQSDFFIIID